MNRKPRTRAYRLVVICVLSGAGWPRTRIAEFLGLSRRALGWWAAQHLPSDVWPCIDGLSPAETVSRTAAVKSGRAAGKPWRIIAAELGLTTSALAWWASQHGLSGEPARGGDYSQKLTPDLVRDLRVFLARARQAPGHVEVQALKAWRAQARVSITVSGLQRAAYGLSWSRVPGALDPPGAPRNDLTRRDHEARRRAVREGRNAGRTMAEIAAGLGISETALKTWAQRFGEVTRRRRAPASHDDHGRGR